ncbi:Down syndrome cell adhesion molecule [Araneus ventricosus]|uniref:Down syndrome cell adhesion molecule n=1 Tax=Araneus ventricosus TaxID=182803 RepID=A0A4Y2ICP6_ARAVE|nr:Down syndrome cell adhesion molecule [Araneus ventricosus]
MTEGERVIVACTTKSRDKSGGQLSFKWLKDGKDLPAKTQAKSFGDFSNIVIDPVSEEDSGNYTCAVTSGGLHDSYTAQLTVMVPPQWIIAPKDVSSFSGEYLVINCRASGKPTPIISWMKSEGRGTEGFAAVSDSETLRLATNGSLIIEQVGKSDEGLYQCMATNSSPNLAPSDFHIFLKLGEFLGGKLFVSDEELENAVTTWFNGLTAEEYDMGILKLVDRYDTCLIVGGDYVEK